MVGTLIRLLNPVLIVLATLYPVVSGAEAAVPAPDSDQDLWSRTRDAAGEWWQRSQDAAGEAWNSTLRLFEDEPQDHFAEVWERILPKLGATLALEERQAELPSHAWFGPDQQSNQQSINELLDAAVEILSISKAQGYRQRIRTLKGEIAQAKEDIADYRRRRVTAPAEAVWEKSAADYERAIAERRADIRQLRQELGAVKAEFADEMRRIGLDFSEDQVELLLTTVVGDNITELGIAFDNVKAITVQLEQLVEESAEDADSARRYYGMYVILLKTLHRMHHKIEQAITEQYLPQIDAIMERAEALSAETRRLQKRAPQKAELLAANLEAQRLTVQAAGVYRAYLQEQSREVRSARIELEQDIRAAWNTYETVLVSTELISLVRASRSLLDSLLERQVPALRPFRSLEMKREFAELTRQLRTSQG
jgi:hypothetical protein